MRRTDRTLDGVPLPAAARLGPAGLARWEALPSELQAALRAHPGWRRWIRPHLDEGAPLATCLDELYRDLVSVGADPYVAWPDDAAGRTRVLLTMQRAGPVRCAPGSVARVGLGLGGRR